MKATTIFILLPFLVLAVPIMDITFSSLRRIFKGQSPFVADAEHIHHKLLHAGFSQKKTVMILTSVAIIAGALASLFMGSAVIKHYFICILAIVIIMLLLNFAKVLTKK
jgi:UDP-GlcNAc:undecaprenyl-phosphate GlcNAc-1-phosphate transferase